MTDRIITDISDFIFVSDAPRRSDVIFIPGGSHPEQPEYAARLYREGYAKLLVPAGGISVKLDKWPGVRSKADIYDKSYSSDCEFFIDVLIKNGVPSSAILGENRSGHTRDNAFFSRELLDLNGIFPKRAIIVCKAFHARRCLMLYKLAFPNTDFIVCPVVCLGITEDNWYKSEVGIKRVTGELARCGNQFESDFTDYIIQKYINAEV